MKRAGLFVVDTRCGVIGNYITVIIEDIRNSLDSVIILLTGGELCDGEEKKIERYADSIFFLPEVNPLLAIREVIIKDEIKSLIKNIDELVIFDDSFYGPFIPFAKIFEEMEKSDSDFWGITKRAEYFEEERLIKEYLQRYFIVFRKKILSSDFFWAFFARNIGVKKIVANNSDFDYGITWFFSENGFSYNAYVKDDDLNIETAFNYNHIKYSPFLILSKYKIPVLPKYCFSENKDLKRGNGEETMNILSYIQETIGYDVDNIWEDLLRKVNISILKDNLGLNYVVSDMKVHELPINKRIIVIAHLYYEDLVEGCLKYLMQVPDSIDILITSSKKIILDTVQERLGQVINNKIETKIVQNRGRDVGAIFVECRDVIRKYDYLCFVHDKKTSGGRGLVTTGRSFHDMVWQTMLSSGNYIKNTIHLLEENKRLGLLSPPIPIHSGYEILLPNGWTLNYEKAREWEKRLGLNVPFDDYNQPFAFSTCFWCKTDALKKIWESDINISDFKEMGQRMDGELNHVLERLIIYVAQDAGYYSALVENSFYASLMQQNLYIYLRERLIEREEKYKKKNNNRLKRYLKDKSKIYIYGAGIEGEKAETVIRNLGFLIDAYIVTDCYFDKCVSNLSPIIKLSDAELKNAGVIIAMNKPNEAEARANLRKIGYNEAIPLFMKRG